MALPSKQQLVPADIEKADFPTAFRGYEQESVRRYLAELAHVLDRQDRFVALGDIDLTIATQDRVEELQDEVTALQAEVERLEQVIGTERRELELARDALDGRRSTTDNTPLTDLDESRIIELLGQETARVLESARSAAAEIVKRSETKAAEVERDAQDALIAARREARAMVASKRAEADELVAKVVNEAEGKARQLTEDADKHREMVIAESSKLLRESEAAADQAETKARQRASQIVSDAEALRRQVLSELVMERSRMRSELDGVAATKDRLVMTLTMARGELDAMVEELADTTVSAPEAAVTEAEAEVEVNALIAELESKRMAANKSSKPSPTKRAGSASRGSDRSESNSPRVVETSPAPESTPVSKGAKASPRVTIDDHDGVTTLEFEVRSTADNQSAAEPGAKAETKPEAKAETRPEAKVEPTGEKKAEPGEDENRKREQSQQTDADRSQTGAEAGPAGVDGFQTIDLDDDPDPGDDQVDTGADELDGHVITTVADRVTKTETERSRGDLLLEEPFAGRLPVHFKARDLALTKHGPNFRRQLRRALNDDQSDVLDRLRGGKGKITADELPPEQEQVERYTSPLRDGLLELARAGARAGGGKGFPDQAVDALVVALAGYIVDRVRVPSVAALEAVTHSDREKILEPIRANYRDFRNTSLTDLADDALYEAFAIGLFHSIPTGAEVAWVVDPRSDPDPVCEINAARTELKKGDPFPSGHARPLALSSCRCLVVSGKG